VTATVILLVLLRYDQAIYEVIAAGQSVALSEFFDLLSHLRGAAFGCLAALVTLGAGIVLGRTKLKQAGLIMLLTVTISVGIVIFLKPMVGRPGPKGFRPRPPDAKLIARRWGRFPSGHTAATFSAAAGLAAVYPPTALLGYTVGMLVAYERIYRGVHYPSDCFAGAWLGVVTARMVARRARRRRWKGTETSETDTAIPARGDPPEADGTTV
jgi:undecaprenyl-diphosphatase